MMVDTLTIARELKAAEMPAAQAEAIAAAIGRSIAESSATKADLENVRVALKADVDGLRVAVKADLKTAKHELRNDIERLRTELEKTRNQLLTWIMSAMVALAGVIIAVVKL